LAFLTYMKTRLVFVSLTL